MLFLFVVVVMFINLPNLGSKKKGAWLRDFVLEFWEKRSGALTVWTPPVSLKLGEKGRGLENLGRLKNPFPP